MCNLLLTLVKHFNSIDFVYLNCLFKRKIETSGGILIFWGEVANNTNIFSVQFPDKNVKRLLLSTQKKQDRDFFGNIFQLLRLLFYTFVANIFQLLRLLSQRKGNKQFVEE